MCFENLSYFTTFRLQKSIGISSSCIVSKRNFKQNTNSRVINCQLLIVLVSLQLVPSTRVSSCRKVSLICGFAIDLFILVSFKEGVKTINSYSSRTFPQTVCGAGVGRPLSENVAKIIKSIFTVLYSPSRFTPKVFAKSGCLFFTPFPIFQN